MTDDTMIDDLENTNFSIVGIYIHNDCAEKYKKVLKSGYFSLNDKYTWNDEKKIIEKVDYIKYLPNDFFEENISVSAIVGKNGSGKSSLLDIIYRIINNFAFHFVPNKTLIELENLHADLYFVNNGKKYVVSVKDKDVTFYNISDKTKENIEKFFYTIVVNYSNHSLLPQDYLKESNTNTPWITNIFHKNDGYQVPIVLNPYKDEHGVLGLYTERDLTFSHLQSILIKLSKEEEKKEFIEGYQLDNIYYQLDERNLAYKLNDRIKFVAKSYRGSSYDEHKLLEINKEEHGVTIVDCIEVFNMLLNDDMSRDFNIIKTFENEYINLEILMNYIKEYLEYSDKYNYNKYKYLYILSSMYLTYKVSKIIYMYDYEDKYKDKFTYTWTKFKNEQTGKIEEVVKKPSPEDWKKLCNEIVKRHSHAEFKIHQTLNFFKLLVTEKENLFEKDTQNKNIIKFNYNKIFKGKNNNLNEKELYEICELLPPNFFKPSIFLKRNHIKESIELFQLSSGELQLIFNNTTIIYHILNLKSVKNLQETKRLCYKNINIILDEIELYAHPIYQQKYISNLIDILKRLNLNNKENKINIIISTHSPFILSDIPKQNILFLEEGVSISTECKPVQTFATNISDLLKDSFFLEKGFIGDFAAKKIKNIIDKLYKMYEESNDNKKKLALDKKTYDEYRNIIELIGECLIKNKLLMILDEIYYNYDYEIINKNIKKIKEYDELERLKIEENKLSRELEKIKDKIKKLPIKNR